MSTQIGHDPGNFYVWRASDELAIHLSLKVVTQLNAHISRAASESQPGELRGLLLGSMVEKPFRAIMIEDFELISPPEYATAEQPDSDDKLFEIACRMAKDKNQNRAVGFFVSGWDGKLSMGQHDLETFSRVFGESGNVALLIQTSKRSNESDAALFYWQDGEAHPRDFGFGFPFDVGQLLGGHPGWRYSSPLDCVPTPASQRPTAPQAHGWTARQQPEPQQPEPQQLEQALAELLMSAPAVSSEGGSRIEWSKLVPTIVLAVIGIGALQLATGSKQTVAAAPAVTERAAPAPEATESAATAPAPVVIEPVASTAPNSETGLGLSVAVRPQQLNIRWNRQSAAITEAQKGLMRITEAGSTRVVPFDQRQLRDGYLTYITKSNDVNIELEVTGKNGGTTSESVRSVAIR